MHRLSTSSQLWVSLGEEPVCLLGFIALVKESELLAILSELPVVSRPVQEFWKKLGSSFARTSSGRRQKASTQSSLAAAMLKCFQVCDYENQNSPRSSYLLTSLYIRSISSLKQVERDLFEIWLHLGKTSIDYYIMVWSCESCQQL